MKIGTRLRVLYHLRRFARPSGNDYRHLEHVRTLLRQNGWFAHSLAHTAKFEENKRAIRERWLFDDLNTQVDAMASLPKGTLGRAYSDFLKLNGLDAQFFRPMPAETDESYYIMRALQTHDLWHVVLDRTTSSDDEIFIQAIMFAQLRWPTSGFLIVGYLWGMLLKNPTHLATALSVVADGWRMGHELPPLFGVRWEELWSLPLEEVRSRLGIPQRTLQSARLH